MNPLLVLSLCLIVVRSSASDEQTYGSGYEPNPPVPFPAAYKDYQILPGTIAPGQTYAFIYPTKARLYEMQDYSLFLAALSPFRILTSVPTGNSNLGGNRCYYAASWSQGSSAAVFVAGSRWGPEKVWVLQLRDGNVAKRSDLTTAVRQQVLPDFNKSHAARYNEYYDFVFEGDEETTAGWKLDDNGHVIIECTCTTDPKELHADRWAVRFQGTWDIASGKFIKKRFTRIPPRPNQAMQRTAGRSAF